MQDENNLTADEISELEMIEDRQRWEAAHECKGHPAGFDPMGKTVYCDGSCRK